MLAIEEEYWTVQYKTRVTGHPEAQFWPPDGDGKYGSEAGALDAANRLAGTHVVTRVVHVTRRVEYGADITRESTES